MKRFVRWAVLIALAPPQIRYVVKRKTLEIVGNIQPAGIIGPGHEIATDSKGNFYIAQTTDYKN